MLVAIEKPREGEPPSVLWIEYLALDGPLEGFVAGAFFFTCPLAR